MDLAVPALLAVLLTVAVVMCAGCVAEVARWLWGRRR